MAQRKDCCACSSRARGHKLAIFLMQMFIFCQDTQFNFSSREKRNDLSPAYTALSLCLAFVNHCVLTVNKAYLLRAVKYFAVLCLSEKNHIHEYSKDFSILSASRSSRDNIWLLVGRAPSF